MQIGNLLEKLTGAGINFHSDVDNLLDVHGVSEFPTGLPNTISMWRGDNYEDNSLEHSTNNIVICNNSASVDLRNSGIEVIVVQDPRVAFAILASQFLPTHQIHLSSEGIAEGVLIPKSSHLGNNVIVENAIIGQNCNIGHNTVIHSGTRIGDNVEIGDNSTIGGPGFGYVNLPNGETLRMPHLGGVEIHDGVHIGSNTAIDRGTIGNTIVGENSRIDNLVHIAHNVVIGKGVFIIAGAEISGSVQIGDRAWIAPQASVRQKLVIGPDAVVGIGSVVVKDVSPGETVMGVPAKPRSS